MKSIFFLLLLITISCSCNNSVKDETPVEIPITEYSLVGTSCQWVNLISNEIIIVNSKSELKKYVDCDVEAFPEIDFSKYTLLLTNGVAYNGVVETTSIFFQDGTNRYIWKVTVRLNVAQVVQGWRAAILVPKLTNKATIVTEVQQSHF